jgi:hypothetical protein
MGKAKRDLRRHAVVNIGKYSLVMPPLRIRSMGLLPDRWGKRKCIHLLHHQSTLPGAAISATICCFGARGHPLLPLTPGPSQHLVWKNLREDVLSLTTADLPSPNG